jgi:rubrerythrin
MCQRDGKVKSMESKKSQKAKEEKKILLTCMKCGYQENGDFYPLDASRCPQCGEIHGHIVLSNSKPTYDRRGRTIGFIPAV